MTNSQLNLADLVCMSHLRWDFVFQRPQHLMSRFAAERRVFFIEEPVFGQVAEPHMKSRHCPQSGVCVNVPQLPEEARPAANAIIAGLVQQLFEQKQIDNPILWMYSPMWLEALPSNLNACAVLYDCMDELSAFKGAPERLKQNEAKLLQMADLVFTGGVSLFEAKRGRHKEVHPFPSGVDVTHFAQARSIHRDPEDQRAIPHPRVGFAGVIDERIDYDLLRQTAELRPDWNFIMIGPVVKVDPASLPQARNIHWLGMKSYSDLPAYFSQWDVAMMPFALNEATRYISPTKTPEFLSAGLPVVSTPIRDVVRPYSELGLVRIAADADEFAAAIQDSMVYTMGMKWRERADAFLQTMSWDSVWQRMNSLIEDCVSANQAPKKSPAAASLFFNGEVARV